MGDAEHGRQELLSLLDRAEAAPPVDAIEVVEDELVARVGARAVSFLIADHRGRSVVRVDRTSWAEPGGWPGGVDLVQAVDLPGTVYERVLRTQQPETDEVDGGVRVAVPVTVRGDALGVMELELPGPPDADALVAIATAARALGYIVVTNRRCTDLFDRGQRTVPFTLPAEIQRRLLPNALSYSSRAVTVAGWLEPASSVGGDTFDYSVERHTLHVSITDAVGHDLGAALLATVLVSALRNGRRRGMPLAEQVRTANDALAGNSPSGTFVTGIVLRVDVRTGRAAVVNAGHPPPLLVRDGEVRELPLDPDVPFGLLPGREFTVHELALRPGDRLVLITDGLLERNTSELDLPGLLARDAQVHAREFVRGLGDAVLGTTDGDLRDDATVLCVDWTGEDGEVPHHDTAAAGPR